MTPTPTVGFRLPRELLERVDAYAARVSASAGVPVSRAAAVTKLLTIALEVEDPGSGRQPRPSSRAPRR